MATDLSKTPKMVRLGKELQELLPQNTAAHVLVKYSDSLPLKEVWRGDQARSSISGDGLRLLGVCCQRQRSVLVHDAEKDTVMKGIMSRRFLSALCVPVFREDKSLLGAILLTSQEVGTFTKEHRYSVERHSREYGQPLIALVQLPEREKEKTPGPLSFLYSPFALASLACTLLFLVIWISAPARKEKVAEPTVAVEPLNSQAKEQASAFLEALQNANYDQAYEFLGPELRTEWSQDDFGVQISEWAKTSTNSQRLESRDITRIQQHHKSAQVTLLESSIEGDRGHWKWSLAKLRNDWVLVKMDGPIQLSTR